MEKYVYPAVFTQEACGYSIRFPDFDSCYTSAETLEDGIKMAQDVLCMTLYDMEEGGVPAPAASSIKDVQTESDEFATLIACDTLEYRKLFHSKAIKKTLTIPAWLNTAAEAAHLNFSGVLQEALKAKLDI